MKFTSLLAPALLLTLAGATSAPALCGDVTGDGKKTANDALAVLRSAVGQPVALQCIGEAPKIQYFNDFGCGSGSSVSTLEFNGYSFSANVDTASAFQTVDLEQATGMHVELCGGDYYFNGPQSLPRDRRIQVFMLLLDPEVYQFPNVEVPANLVFYDLGPIDAALTVGASPGAPQEIGVLFGGRVQ